MEVTRTISQLVNEIRSEYIAQFGQLKFGKIRLNCSSTIESWVCDLIEKHPDRDIYQEWKDILDGIDVTEYGKLELFHYTDFSVIYGDWNPEDYWSAFGGIYRTCRSTVIDLENGCTIIKPFDKFFNVNELHETSQDIVSSLIEKAKRVEISEKLDGSIACFSSRYTGYGHNSIHIYSCTSQSLNPDTSWHLRDARKFFDQDAGLQKLIRDHVGWTFMCEMLSKEDAHVVYYPESEYGLHLIGVRDSIGYLLNYDQVIELANQYGVQTTRVFDKTFEQVMGELDDKKSDEAEGFVIRVDDQFFKLKYNDYVQMHKMISRLVSASGVIEAYRDGKLDDLLSKVPLTYKGQITDIVNEIKLCISNLNRSCEIVLGICNGFTDFVTKAKYIQRYIPKGLQGYCFSAIKNQPVTIFKNGRTVRLKDIRELNRICENYLAGPKWIDRLDGNPNALPSDTSGQRASETELMAKRPHISFNSEEFSC